MFWQKAKTIGTFKVEHHYASNCVVFSTNLTDYDLVRFFCHYFDRQAINCGSPLSSALVDDVFEIASNIIENGPGISNTELARLFQGVTWKVVDSFQSEDPIVFTGELRHKHTTHVHLKIPFLTPVPIEPVACNGTLALLHFLVDKGQKELRFFLPLALIRMCNIYQEHGIPGPTRTSQVSSASLEWLAQMASQLEG
jgi:hypothetical protein